MGDIDQTLGQQLEAALRALRGALAEAADAASSAQARLSDIVALERRVHDLDSRLSELETAVALARETLNIPTAQTSGQQAAFPTLRAVPAWQDDDADEDVTEEPTATPDDAPAPCLRLEVEKKIGSLDLKQVDAAVNEIPPITDVTLVDYDGCRATLRLWISESDEPEAISERLVKELRSRLGGEAIAEVQVAFERENAA